MVDSKDEEVYSGNKVTVDPVVIKVLAEQNAMYGVKAEDLFRLNDDHLIKNWVKAYRLRWERRQIRLKILHVRLLVLVLIGTILTDLAFENAPLIWTCGLVLAGLVSWSIWLARR